MDVKYDIFSQDEKKIVYVRPVDVADLPDEVKEQAGDIKTLYAVHDEDGQQLALVRDMKLAYVLARQYDYSPVMVH